MKVNLDFAARRKKAVVSNLSNNDRWEYWTHGIGNILKKHTYPCLLVGASKQVHMVCLWPMGAAVVAM